MVSFCRTGAPRADAHEHKFEPGYKVRYELWSACIVVKDNGGANGIIGCKKHTKVLQSLFAMATTTLVVVPRHVVMYGATILIKPLPRHLVVVVVVVVAQ